MNEQKVIKVTTLLYSEIRILFEMKPLELAVVVGERIWKCLQIFDVFGLELLPSHDEVVRTSAHARICCHSEGLLDLIFEVRVGHEEVQVIQTLFSSFAGNEIDG